MGIDQVAFGAQLRRLRAWAAAHLPELGIFALGTALRLSMGAGYDVRAGFDYQSHWDYANYLAQHHALPPLTFNTTTYHPPLYYLLCALLIGAGLGPGALGWLAALLGTARLAIVWAGLARWLPESRLARGCGLAAAAVLPASLQLDGMVTNETLFALLAALALLFAPAGIAAIRAGRLSPVVSLAVLLSLALLTKVSAGTIILAVALAAGLEIARAERPAQALRTRARSLAVGAGIVVALTGWYFVRNQILYGKPSPTGYDGWAKAVQAPFEGTPYLDRRSLGFFVGFDPAVFADPYYPVGYVPRSRFFSVLLASTFTDYYSCRFARTNPDEAPLSRHGRPLPPRGVQLAGWSTKGGAVLAILTLLAWLAALRRLWRRPFDRRLVLLWAPALALLGQLHFAVRYPNDTFGPVKGSYLQFVAPIACGLYGLAVAWLWRRRWSRPAALAAIAALCLVFSYTAYARWPRERAGATTAAPFWSPQPAAARAISTPERGKG